MEARFARLKLVLQELGIADTIKTIDDRMTVQKSVYLAQRLGVKLGYRFHWYVHGPYCPSLTQDYYGMDTESRNVDSIPRMPAVVENRLATLRDRIDPPSALGLERPKWLELLASLDYLLHVRGMAQEEATKVLRDEKPHLTDFIEPGLKALQVLELG